MSTLYSAQFETPFGSMRVASSDEGLAFVQLPLAHGRGFTGWIKRFAPEAELREGFEPNKAAIQQISDFLEGKRETFELSLDLRATDFQRKVYRALERIPYGEKRSYVEIATAIGQPRASRAVGTANGANPLSLVIPCHRVINAGGKLGGYAGGLPMKKRLLAMEQRRPLAGQLL